MRAARVTTLDGPAAVTVEQVDTPVRGDGEVLVEVHAAGVTFPEVLQSRGRYQHRPELPFTPGSEVAGTVLEAPDGSPLRPGDRVAAFMATGGYAEQAAAPAELVFPLPDRVSFVAGAALPMNYLTVELALGLRGRLQAGETLLVHGAGGGIGTAGIQLAKALGARVVAVVSSEAKGEAARQAGADEVVPVDGFRAAVQALGGADVVLDPVGGDRFTDSLRSLRPGGRLLVVGFTAGEIPTVKVNRLLLNNIDVVGVGWGAYALARPGYAASQWDRLRPHLESGALDPVIGSTRPLAEAAQALASIEDRTAVGKVVLTVR
jgi:NADPH2:quinone reductase